MRTNERKIPCFLTNRDLLSPIRTMVEQLSLADNVGPITIIDNGSTYEPLLRWYGEQKLARVVLEAGTNTNHVLWHGGRDAKWRELMGGEHDFYFQSDGDIDVGEVPRDFLLKLAHELRSTDFYRKVGLSLRIDDLPDNPMTRYVRQREAEYWQTNMSGWWLGNIDTTAAVYRANEGWRGYGPALRCAPPYCGRHLPWYVDPASLDMSDMGNEWVYFAHHANRRVSSWCWHLKKET